MKRIFKAYMRMFRACKNYGKDMVYMSIAEHGTLSDLGLRYAVAQFGSPKQYRREV